MRNSRLIVGIIMALAFVGLLLWRTLASQQAECRICVAYNSKHYCAAASAASNREAIRAAQTTACGPITNGMDEITACGNSVPTSEVCRTR